MATTKIPQELLEKTSITFADGEILNFGASNDLKIKHDGSNSFIQNTTGNLFIENSITKIMNRAGNETIASFNQDGAVELYHNNVKKIETTSAGASVTGSLDISGDIDVDGTTNLDVVDIDGAVDMASTLTLAGVLSVTANASSEISHRIQNINAGGESSLYITNEASNAAGLGLGTTGSSYSAAGGYFQDASHVVAGTSISGGLALMTRNTGGAAHMRFYTGGHTNERMRIAADGKIGIGGGTNYAGSALTYKLTVDSADASGSVLEGHRTGNSRIEIYQNATGGQYIDALGSTPFLQLRTAGASRLNIDGSGAVTIPGAVTLNSNFLAEGYARTKQYFQVFEGGAQVGFIGKEKSILGSGSSLNMCFFAEGISGGGDIHFMTGGAGTKRLSILANGNVGAGNNAPVGKIHISGNSDVSDADCQLIIDDADSTVGSRIPSIQFRSNVSGTVTNQGRIRSTDTQGMILSGSASQGDDLVVKNAGVGVGIVPTHTLSVSGANAKVVAHSTADSQTVGFQARYLDHATLQGSFEYTTGDARLWIDNKFNGNNAYYGDIQFRNCNNGSSTLQNRLVIKGSTGNVGIGTNVPGSLLTVHNSATSGNTQLHIHNDKTGDAAVLKLEGKRTSLNDTAQLLFANNGNNVAKIDARSAADDGALRFFTSASGTGSTIAEAMSIGNDGAITHSMTGQNTTSINTTNSDGPITLFKNNGTTRGMIGNAEGLMNGGTSNFGIRATADLIISTGGGTARMRINASGDVLIGNTTVQPSSNHNNQAGFGYDVSASQLQIAATTNNAVMDLSRNSSNDGNWITFRKQGTIYGNIGTYGGTMYVGSVNGGIMFNGTDIEATTGGATRANNTVSLGSTNFRFKDGHFHGSLYAHGGAFVIATDGGGSYLGKTDNSSLRLVTANASRMTITNTGIVGVGGSSIKSMHATSSAGATTMAVAGPIGSGYAMGDYGSNNIPRIYRDWFVYNSSSSTTHLYVHMKTDLWAGGSGLGNSQFTMSCFTYNNYYAYGGAQGQGSIGWHNWSASFYNIQLINNGTLQLVQSSYVSSDGYVVLVALLGAGYAQFSIDWAQWAGYTFREKRVTAVTRTSSANGAY